MKTTEERTSRYCLLVIAVLSAVMVLSSCGPNTSEQGIEYGIASPPNYDFEYHLNHLTIGVGLFHPDYGHPARVDVFEGATLCARKTLTAHPEKFTLKNNRECSSFTLNFQYVHASGDCQPGGLYLISGNVTDPDSGQSFDYRGMILGGWNQQRNAVQPWITPFDAPTLVSQTAQSNVLPDDPVHTLGQWTCHVDYLSSVIPPAGCSLQTTVNLALTLADESIEARVFEYNVTETNSGGNVTASVASDTAGAPSASVMLDERAWPVVARRLSFSGLDVLRDAQALTSVTFTQPAQVDQLPVSFATALRPLFEIGSIIDITRNYSSPLNYPNAPFSSHLARFFSMVTLPIANSCQSLSVKPRIPVSVGVYLSTPLPGVGIPFITPVQIVPNYQFTPGIDDRIDCSASPNPGFCCSLATSIATYTATYGAPDPAASYILEITFSSGTISQPVLHVRNIVVPVSRISE